MPALLKIRANRLWAIGVGAATVVIEVKWSNNAGVSTSLVNQLGIEYLVGAKLTHGIYLVGWSVKGRWSDPTTEGPANVRSMLDWLAAIRRQARQFSQDHPDVTIEPVIVDLVWPPPKTAQTAAAARKAAGRGARGGRRPHQRQQPGIT